MPSRCPPSRCALLMALCGVLLWVAPALAAWNLPVDSGGAVHHDALGGAQVVESQSGGSGLASFKPERPPDKLALVRTEAASSEPGSPRGLTSTVRFMSGGISTVKLPGIRAPPALAIST